jgi:gluconate 2-dehydrogenase gamma chain
MARHYTRREMLERAAAVGTAGALPARALAQAVTGAEPFEHFDARESRALEAVVARLIPADENGPGALEAGAARFIDRSLSNALAGALDTYRAGLAALDAHARDVAGGAFADLAARDQDRVLGDLERNVASGFTPDASTFFELVRTHTIQGTFSDPSYGGNADFIGWELVGYPGVRLAVAADDQRMTAQLPLNRVSAYDLPMFDTDESVRDDEERGRDR